jgi:hydrogenase maturation protein HypF
VTTNRLEQDGVREIGARTIVISGRVQGVGFRPFIYRMANRFGIAGWVRNRSGQVQIHAEGSPENLQEFEMALIADAPPLARPEMGGVSTVPPDGLRDFRILPSAGADIADIHLPPDLFCCDDCLEEMQTASERRYRYPFTNCTQCGPRFTIINSLPYDRPNTAMTGFPLCPNCRREYDNPLDRRFHAQPLACPECGPRLTFNRQRNDTSHGEQALADTISLISEGGIVAVKGIGGYHLMCDPENNRAVKRLRERKHRPTKPFAVMFPLAGDDGLDLVRANVSIDAGSAAACIDPARPIVLALRKPESTLSEALAPGLSELGVFLPYSPLHHLLLSDFGAPLVATSGNISGEPVITENDEAEERLSGIADAFLHHDRPIVRPADDSVVRIIGNVPRMIRCGRGMAPVEIDLPRKLLEPIVAVGGHMKGAVALAWENRAVFSPHIGELDSPRSLAVFAQAITDLQQIYQVEARTVVCDANPHYASARWARTSGLPVSKVQHHVAHASALAGEYPHIDRWLTFTWDGIGLGGNGALWGGEVFAGRPGFWRRVGSLRTFQLPGGDKAGREPWRSAAALMWEAAMDWRPPLGDLDLVAEAWRKRVGTYETSSAGRLFDAAAALVLGIDKTSFESEGPMMLEGIAEPNCDGVDMPLETDSDGILRIDWEPLLDILADDAIPVEKRSGMFHETVARALASQAIALKQTSEFSTVGLTGGVFQNKFLCERVASLLEAQGIPVLQHSTVPANDGGLAFGQIIEYIHSDSDITNA